MNKNDKNSRLKNIYTDFLRPLNGELMRVLNIDINYHSGSGNWLHYSNDKDKVIEVFDATGGYGSNLLGHKNQVLQNHLIEKLPNMAPANVQGSLRPAAAKLGKHLSDLLTSTLGTGPWVTTLSNSGAEAVEIALKHSLLSHKNDCELSAYKAQTFTNQLFILLEETPELLTEIKSNFGDFFPRLRSDITKLSTSKELISFIEDYNNRITNHLPAFLAVENSFHGKTMGALSVTSNEKYSKAFYLNQGLLRTHFISRGGENLGSVIEQEKKHLVFGRISKGKVCFNKLEIIKIAAAIVEPVQGEGGITPLTLELLTALRKTSKKFGFQLIFDEIQSGLYRTGTFTSGEQFKIRADTYCFSKALGGGLVKVAATCTLKSHYIKEFGHIHTSTFAEDEMSSEVALKALEMMTKDSKRVDYSLLKKELEILAKKYSDIIHPIRGLGLMCAMEFKEKHIKECLEFKIFDDSQFTGYFFSSALLHNNNIRISPSLSSMRSLRIEPSLYTTPEEIAFLIKGLEKLLDAVKNYDMTYFFSHIYPGEKIESGTFAHAEGLARRPSGADKTLFLCHITDYEQTRQYLSSLLNVTEEVFQKKVSKISHFMDFGEGYKDIVKNDIGDETEYIVYVLPMDSEELVKIMQSGDTLGVVKKIQNAIMYAKDIGAKTVGLGQFTSILTNSGLMLDSMGLNLTTGNAYTTYLVLEATKKAALEMGIDINKSRISCIGAPGNIMSVTSSLIANYCQSLNLFYHSTPKKSKKLTKAIVRIIKDSLASPLISNFNRSITELTKGNPDWENNIFEFLEKKEVISVLATTTDLASLQDSQIIIAGASTSSPILFDKHISPDTLLVDIGVPGNIDKSIPEKVKNCRLILGGIAKLPILSQGPQQNIDAHAFPLDSGACYACLAESLILTMAKQKSIRNIGELTAKKVLEIGEMAINMHFTLGSFKNKTTL